MGGPVTVLLAARRVEAGVLVRAHVDEAAGARADVKEGGEPVREAKREVMRGGEVRREDERR